VPTRDERRDRTLRSSLHTSLAASLARVATAARAAGARGGAQYRMARKSSLRFAVAVPRRARRSTRRATPGRPAAPRAAPGSSGPTRGRRRGRACVVTSRQPRPAPLPLWACRLQPGAGQRYLFAWRCRPSCRVVAIWRGSRLSALACTGALVARAEELTNFIVPAVSLNTEVSSDLS
jgi:hypothetical protein